jgi:radical SAM superfamily enzyme YgiQ (UPF0313 family)
MVTTLLINLPRQEAERPPAVIAGLAGICRSANVDYEVADLNLAVILNFTQADWREFQNYLGYYNNVCSDQIIENFRALSSQSLPKKDFTIIAVSLFTYETIRAANVVFPILRKLYPNSKIVIGGHGADFADPDHNNLPFYKHMLRKGLIDAYLLGEAEEIFKEYLSSSDNWRNLDQKHTVNNLNNIPFACYDKIPPQNYLHSGIIGTYITGSRGCVRNCTFCDVNHLWGKFRFRSAQHIFDEILHHHLNYKTELIEFTDNLINGSLSEFKKLNQLLVSAQTQYPSLKNLRYRGDFICRPQNQFTEEDFHLMRQAGGTDLLVGIESFSEPVRYHMGKKFTNSDIDFHLYACGKYGITNTFLMQVGYPTETIEDHEINKQYLHRYQKYALSKVIKLIRWGFTTSILPGSPLDTIHRHTLPIVSSVGIDEVYGESWWVNFNNPALTYEERIRRRMELHYLSKNLQYNQPRVHDEFLSMLATLRTRYSNTNTNKTKINIKVHQ